MIENDTATAYISPVINIVTTKETVPLRMRGQQTLHVLQIQPQQSHSTKYIQSFVTISW